MIFKKVLQPNRWILLCMPPISFAALIFIFEIQNTKSTLAYLVYCMSAYSLIIWISALPKMIKRMKSDIRNSKIMQKATASKIMGRHLTDTAFRGSINIYQGMTVNFSMWCSVLLQESAMLQCGLYLWRCIIWCWEFCGCI